MHWATSNRCDSDPPPRLRIYEHDDRRETLDRPVNVDMTGVHSRDGILIAAGGPIRRDASFDRQPTVADMTPTILALMGLPVGRDISGRVLEEMIEPEFLARRYLEALGYLD